MAASSSIQKRSFKYEVFLSFRGEDTRKGFVDHLYHALDNRGITTYKDDEKIQKGKRIDDQLIRSIKDSKLFIIVFSKNYASSSWCLDELVHIMECHKTKEQTAYPIFYDVEPTEVRHQSGAVEDAFAKVVVKHENEEVAGKWRDALTEAADLAGRELKTTCDGHEAKFIQIIVQDISLELRSINSSVDDKLVGMETRVKMVVSSLEIGFDDVRMIGIKGMGGIGKTTLARAVFDHISGSFEGKSFVENVREGSKGSGLEELQKKVLSAVSNYQSIVVTSVSDGKNMIKNTMGSRKVLVVLDDVDSIAQLEALAGEPTWFKPGSRIIITTRDEQVLIAHGVYSDNIHDVNLLSHHEAICLFSRNAFKREVPNPGYEELSRKVVYYAAGLPLTIKVLGSHLYGRTKREWLDAIERLKTIPLKQTLEKLEISYDGLENDQKEIFLDIACILKGERKSKAIRILKGCGFHAEIGLRVLEQKSLITLSTIWFPLDDHPLLLHDHIEEMGMHIVYRLHPHEPSRRSRLWIKEEIEEILVNDSGTEATRSIKLQNTDLDPAIIMKGLRTMKKLKYLSVDDGFRKWKIDEVSQCFPNTLRSLRWDSYPGWCLPKTFQANKLVNLELEYSNISQLWEGGEKKVLNNLVFLDLSHSKVRTFDLGLTPCLETLNLGNCFDLVELHVAFECPKLNFLNLSGSKVSNFNLGMTPHLETLDLGKCVGFVELHVPVECPRLKFLDLSGSKVTNLNLGLTPNLIELNLEGCYCLQEIHAPMGCLSNLGYLNLTGCLRFEYFLVDIRTPCDYLAKLELTTESPYICHLHPNNILPKFQFKCKYDGPQSLNGNVEKLISFGLCACTNLASFWDTICRLQCLGKLTLVGNIPEMSKDLWQLESLEELHLSMKVIKHIPDSICMLKHLTHLELKSCWFLEQLPKDLGRLECLKKLILTECVQLRDIPNSICELKRLIYLDLSYCILVEKLPKEFGRLERLIELDIEGAGISRLPQSIFQLKGLLIVGSRWQLESYGFTSFHIAIFKSRYTARCYI